MIRTKYKLSSIARNSLRDAAKNKKFRALYYPCLSVVDSIINSIPDLIILPENDISKLGFDIILSCGDTSSQITNRSIEYHRPVINISIFDKKINIDEKENIHIIDITEDKIRSLFPRPKISINRDNKIDLLYIRDKDPGTSSMINRFLSVKNISFKTINPEDFMLIDINNLMDIFSRYRTIITNTNTIDLYAAAISGANAITFNSAINNPGFSTYVSEENFEKIAKDDSIIKPIDAIPYATNELDLFNKNILKKIKEISNSQFIL